jgi:hypothetical protein
METLKMAMFDGKEEDEVIELVRGLVSFRTDSSVTTMKEVGHTPTVGVYVREPYHAIGYKPKFFIDEYLWKFLHDRLIKPDWVRG